MSRPTNHAEHAEITPPGASLPALLALNGVLLGVLGLLCLAPLASAARQPARARGEYTMVGGQIQGSNTNAVYILDSSNQELIAMRWDPTRKGLEGIGFRDLTADAVQADPGR